LSYTFINNERLGIRVPDLSVEWGQLKIEEQEQLLSEWENIRGSIPDRIKDRELIINKKQAKLNDEENFQTSCDLTWEIAELASQINDLHLWYRVNQELISDSKRHS
jgi:hypothetical protein